MGCVSGKRSFGDPQAAEREAKRIRRRNSERMHVYRCRKCGRWHLTHADGRDRLFREWGDSDVLESYVA